MLTKTLLLNKMMNKRFKEIYHSLRTKSLEIYLSMLMRINKIMNLYLLPVMNLTTALRYIIHTQSENIEKLKFLIL